MNLSNNSSLFSTSDKSLQTRKKKNSYKINKIKLIKKSPQNNKINNITLQLDNINNNNNLNNQLITTTNEAFLNYLMKKKKKLNFFYNKINY